MERRRGRKEQRIMLRMERKFEMRRWDLQSFRLLLAVRSER